MNLLDNFKREINDQLKTPAGAVIVFLLLVFAGLLISMGLNAWDHQQFTYLAKSFLQGKLFFTSTLNTWHDAAYFAGHYYWPLGPFPALLLIPFVAVGNLFGVFFYQGYLQIFITLAILWLVYRVAITSNYAKTDALYLAFAFTVSSTLLYGNLFPFSWSFAHAITVLFLWLAIYEYLTRKRYWLIGMCFAAILLTRFTAALGISFFFFMIVTAKEPVGLKLRRLIELFFPLLPALGLIALYNYLRFNSFFEFGYSYQILTKEFAAARAFGLMSVIHIPGNLYYFLLGHPLPIWRDGLSHVLKPPYFAADPWGMSIFITSPYYLYLFTGQYKTRIAKALWATVFIVALPIFMYYGIGYVQVGYRYALDFLPWLFLLLMGTLKENGNHVPARLKALIGLGFFLNLYFVFSLGFLNLLPIIPG